MISLVQKVTRRKGVATTINLQCQKTLKRRIAHKSTERNGTKKNGHLDGYQCRRKDHIKHVVVFAIKIVPLENEN